MQNTNGKEQEVEKAAEEYANNLSHDPTEQGCLYSGFVSGFLAALSHHTTTVLVGEEILKFIKEEPVYFFLSNILRYVSPENMKILSDEILKRLPQPSTVLGWVDVKDDLPPKDGGVWGDSVSCIVCDLSEGSYNETTTGTAWYNYERKEWYILHFSTSSEPIEVTHWMPLPPEPNTIIKPFDFDKLDKDIKTMFPMKSNSTPTNEIEPDRFPETLTEGQLKYYNEVSGALKRDYEEKMWLLKQKIMSDKDGG